MKFWAGEIDSYNLTVSANEKVAKLMADQAAAGAKAGWIDDLVASLPPLWRHQGETAVIEVNGPLVAGFAGLGRMFGTVGYDDLLNATIEAASHVETKKLLFHINTPGGDVTGLMEACEMLGQITAMKPSATHTTEMMCSAGYWLASAIKDNVITAGPTAQVGSIGILRIHTEQSKAMEDRGVKVTVIRSGKYKAELNSVEELTPEIKARVESQMADVHGMFRAQVAKGRPNLSAEDLAEVTEGQTFLGKRAVQAGLADKTGSFDLALNLLDKRKHSRDTSSNSKGKAMQLTPEQLKAISAGAPLASFGLNDDGTAMTAAELEAYAAKVRADADAKVAQDAEDTRAKAEAAAAAANQAQAPPADGMSALLDKLTASATEIANLKAAAVATAAMAATHADLLTIARSATAKMLIPMGGSQAAVDGMDAAAVIAEHARVTPLFLEKFPAGRQSQASNEDSTHQDQKAAMPLGFQFAVKAAPTAKR
jgi:signal peptide peptidase SppA